MTSVTAAHLLRLELAFLIVFSVLLLAIPNTTTRVLGLPPAGSSFWPRLVGALLLGLAVAVVATDQGWLTVTTTKGPLATGIELGAFVAINLTLAFVLMTTLVSASPVPTRRGKLFLWTLALALVVLGFTQIAYVV